MDRGKLDNPENDTASLLLECALQNLPVFVTGAHICPSPNLVSTPFCFPTRLSRGTIF